MNNMHPSQPYNPLVSIALTTFNGRDLLREQLDSILKQTYQNYEVVMSDDGSDADTVAVLDEYCAKDTRFRWSRSPLKRGFIKNTQNAISLCKGEIVVLCDQDDVWFPHKLQSHVDAYRDPSVMWAFNRCVLTDGDGNETGHIEDILPDYYRHKTMLENTWGTCIGAAQTSYRTEILKRAMPIPDYAPAHDSWIQLAIYPTKPFFIDSVANTYRQHGNNMIGFAATNTEADRVREQQAINDNLRYLRQLAMNRRLPLWKNIVFAGVYAAKIVRRWWRQVTGYTRPH